MLTAWDRVHESVLALPDHERQDRLERVRTRTRLGELACPTCQQSLWLRAGEVRIPHFGHGNLNDCPQGRVSEAVLAARRQLYQFFRSRIDAAKLLGELELEPRVPELEKLVSLDLLLRRKERKSVAVLLVEASLKPEVRAGVRSHLSGKGWLFRPVLLQARLKRVPETEDEFMLDTTQREFRLRSPYDLRPPQFGSPGGTLHLIDAQAERWTTLRALVLVHEPQVFASGSVRSSAMNQLLWSEGYSEWVHPGEAEGLRAFREAQAAEAERSRKAQQGLAPVFAPKLLRTATPVIPTVIEEDEQDQNDQNDKPEEPDESEQGEPLPAWLAGGLVCTGCGQRTGEWQNASPGKDICVCRNCFAKGVRLPAEA